MAHLLRPRARRRPNALFGVAGVAYNGVTPAVNGALVKPGSTTLSVLVNANGTYQTLAFFQSYANVQSFLKNATATNMTYMLSAQLLTMEFSVALGKVNPNTLLFLGAGSAINTWSNNGQGSNLQGNLNSGASTYGLTGTNSSGFISLQSIMNYAIQMLINYPSATSSSAARTFEEVLKIVLDAANNDLAIFAS
jgi:hypothetical protein